jgi:hypothetical protein
MNNVNRRLRKSQENKDSLTSVALAVGATQGYYSLSAIPLLKSNDGP